MIAKIAVSAATYAIDKPYSYRVGENMALAVGQRVMVPFGWFMGFVGRKLKQNSMKACPH